MPSHKNSKQGDIIRLRHMLDAANQILQFTDGCSQEDLENDQMRALAVVRLVEIIGEAAKNVSPEIQALSPDIPWKQIKGTRDRVAHVYFDLDLDIIWEIVSQNLRPLIQNIEQLIAQLENE